MADMVRFFSLIPAKGTEKTNQLLNYFKYMQGSESWITPETGFYKKYRKHPPRIILLSLVVNNDNC